MFRSDDRAAAPFAWSGDDPVSRAVRAGCDVVERAMRRGFGLAGDPAAGPGGPGMPGPWTAGQFVDAMTGAFTQWAQWMDAWSAMARSAMGGPGAWPGPGPAAQPAPSPATAAAPLRVTVELRCARAASVALELSPGAIGPFEVHGLLAPASAAAPPITDVAFTMTGDGVKISVGAIDQHPAGTYAGAVLAQGRACGTLTLRLI
ncbi:MAG TPA: hypothetical protein VFT22_25155 [Kofleriaceae bacterium]|nr:hypothetical protein [Kofleriaceae bacterium]